tara:strand:+ start:623 stop:1294 length:672 start_codon:yes stop_codon:yes gene_type:complete
MINMSKKTRKHCRLCQHTQREEFEDTINSISMTPDELDQKMGWPSGATSRHMRNHTSEYEEKSNPKCKLCVHPSRDIFEQGLSSAELKPTDLAASIGTTKEQLQLHMKSHLQPLVQKSAAALLAKKEVDEIDVLSNNIKRLDVKLDLLFEKEELDSKQIDSLTKLAREVRESLKYLMEFKGKLVHKRQDTIIVAQMQIVKEVLAQQHPTVWLDVRNEMERKLQ